MHLHFTACAYRIPAVCGAGCRTMPETEGEALRAVRVCQELLATWVHRLYEAGAAIILSTQIQVLAVLIESRAASQASL